MSTRLVLATLVVLSMLSIGTPARAQGKKYALLVGVKQYDDTAFGKLAHAENDVNELAKVLASSGYEVVLLTTSRGVKDVSLNPTAANVRAALKGLCDKSKKDDLLLVGLSGHGLLTTVVDPKTKKRTEESVFCPVDARPRAEQERTKPRPPPRESRGSRSRSRARRTHRSNGCG